MADIASLQAAENDIWNDIKLFIWYYLTSRETSICDPLSKENKKSIHARFYIYTCNHYIDKLEF